VLAREADITQVLHILHLQPLRLLLFAPQHKNYAIHKQESRAAARRPLKSMPQ